MQDKKCFTTVCLEIRVLFLLTLFTRVSAFSKTNGTNDKGDKGSISSDLLSVSTQDNTITTTFDHPSHPLNEIVTECLLKFSFPCFQKKVLVFLDRINRMEKINLLGQVLSVVRIKGDHTPPITEELLTARKVTDEGSLTTLLDLTIDRFLETHVIQITIPGFLDEYPEPTSYYVNIASKNSIQEGRGKKGGGGGGGKGMKKMMQALGGMMMMKLAMAGPMMAKLIAGKAMIGMMAGMMSIMMSKAMLIAMLMKKKGGGGGGGGCSNPCGGGGGGGGNGGGGGYSYGPPGGGGGGDWNGGGGGGGWDRSLTAKKSYSPYYSGSNMPYEDTNDPRNVK